MKIQPDTVLEILSTVYYKAMWGDDFHEDRTTKEVFHGSRGDSTVDMMHKAATGSVYGGENFTALSLGLRDSGAMTFFLPDEGTDVDELLDSPALMEAIEADSESDNRYYSLVHLSLPKFKVSAKTNLIEAIRSMGVTDALNYTLADFTPLTTQADYIHLSKAEQAATVEIDEHGVKGAAYTELEMMAGSSAIEDEMDFVLDRPFLFTVTGLDGSILFSGVVRNID